MSSSSKTTPRDQMSHFASWRKRTTAGGSFATFCGQLINPLVVKDSFLRGSAIFSQKVAKRPWTTEQIKQRGNRGEGHGGEVFKVSAGVMQSFTEFVRTDLSLRGLIVQKQRWVWQYEARRHGHTNKPNVTYTLTLTRANLQTYKGKKRETERSRKKRKTERKKKETHKSINNGNI